MNETTKTDATAIAGSDMLAEGILIPTVKPLWIILGAQNFPDYTSIRCTKHEAINSFLHGSSMSWRKAKRYGWKCVKVSISFNVCR